MNLLAARDVGFETGGLSLLSAVDLQVAAGELVAVIGPNGAGKSTLVGVLAGDVAPTTGAVELGGRSVDDLDYAELAERRAVLSQRRVSGIPFSVAEVVAMGAHRSGDLSGMDAVMQAVDIGDIAARPVGLLSGGEHTRVELARVLMQGAPLLLLDEPLAALDIAHEERVLRHLRSVLGEGRGVLAVFHDLSAAATYADRIVLLAGGQVVASGERREVLDPGILSDAYGHPMQVHRVGGRIVVLPAD